MNKPDLQRKWKLILLSMLLVTLGFAIVAYSPIGGEFYATYISALIGLNAVYGGANVASKFIEKKEEVAKE